MEAMLVQLGATVALVEAPFTPEVGAYHQHAQVTATTSRITTATAPRASTASSARC